MLGHTNRLCRVLCLNVNEKAVPLSVCAKANEGDASFRFTQFVLMNVRCRCRREEDGRTSFRRWKETEWNTDGSYDIELSSSPASCEPQPNESLDGSFVPTIGRLCCCARKREYSNKKYWMNERFVRRLRCICTSWQTRKITTLNLNKKKGTLL